MKPVRLRQRARRDLAEAIAWYRERNNDVAARLAAEVRRHSSTLSTSPTQEAASQAWTTRTYDNFRCTTSHTLLYSFDFRHTCQCWRSHTSDVGRDIGDSKKKPKSL